MSYVVVEHTLDNGVYRLAVGWAEEHELPEVDENGNVMFDGEEPELDADGEPVMTEQVVTDENGEPVFDDEVPQIGDDGEPVTVTVADENGDEHSEPMMAPGPMLTEQVPVMRPVVKMQTVQVISAVEDFLFSAEDERWKRFKGPDTIAAKQREIVLETLRQRDEEAEQAAARQVRAQVLSEPGSTL